MDLNMQAQRHFLQNTMFQKYDARFVQLNKRLIVSATSATQTTTVSSASKSNSGRRRNEMAQAIFSLIEKRYQVDIKAKEWSKARRYIYHATTKDSTKSPSTTSASSRNNGARKRKKQQPLSIEQAETVLQYLEDELIPSHIPSSYSVGEDVQIPYIIQSIPRILKRNVNTQIKPTIQFLKQLYIENGIFYIAIQRNPNLLLTTVRVGDSDENNNSSKRRKLLQGEHNSNDSAFDVSDENETMSTIGTDPLSTLLTSTPHPGSQSVEAYLLAMNLGFTKKSINDIKLYVDTLQPASEPELVKSKIDPIVQYLLSTVSCSNPNNSTIVKKFSSDEMLKRRKIIGKILASNPKIMTLNLQSNIIPKVEFLESIGRRSSSKITNGIDLNDPDQHCDDECIEFLMNVFRKFPNILGLSLRHNLIPTLDLVSSVIQTSVQCVWSLEGTEKGSDVDETSSIPKGSMSSASSSISTVLRRIVMNHPQLFGLSLSNLKEKVDFFNTIECLERKSVSNDIDERDLLLDRPALAARVMTTAPSVYSLSLQQNIAPTVGCLAKLWGYDVSSLDQDDNHDSMNKSNCTNSDYYHHNQLGRKIGEYPLVLTLSLEGNIQPTINFYNRTGYVHLDSSGKSVVNDNKERESSKRYGEYLPARYLAASLFNRLLPRWNYYVVEESKRINEEENCLKKDMKSNGDEKIRKRTLLPPPLHLIACASDEKFCKQMEFDLNMYIKFKEEAVPRLKFSSQFDTWLKTGRPIDIS